MIRADNATELIVAQGRAKPAPTVWGKCQSLNTESYGCFESIYKKLTVDQVEPNDGIEETIFFQVDPNSNSDTLGRFPSNITESLNSQEKEQLGIRREHDAQILDDRSEATGARDQSRDYLGHAFFFAKNIGVPMIFLMFCNLLYAYLLTFD